MLKWRHRPPHQSDALLELCFTNWCILNWWRSDINYIHQVKTGLVKSTHCILQDWQGMTWKMEASETSRTEEGAQTFATSRAMGYESPIAYFLQIQEGSYNLQTCRDAIEQSTRFCTQRFMISCHRQFMMITYWLWRQFVMITYWLWWLQRTTLLGCSAPFPWAMQLTSSTREPGPRSAFYQSCKSVGRKACKDQS
jgi:hypothetical protein